LGIILEFSVLRCYISSPQYSTCTSS